MPATKKTPKVHNYVKRGLKPITVPLTQDEYALIKEAAGHAGQSKGVFIARAAKVAAMKVLRVLGK